MLELLAPLVRAQTLKFEQRYRYDTHYLRHLFRLSPRAFLRFRHVLDNANFHDGVPAVALYTVKFLSISREDCGPCAQLTLDQAREAGVPTATLQALVAADPSQLDSDGQLAWHYAQAALDRSPETPAWCAAVVERWGAPALATLALALVTARNFPAMKQALGVASPSCQRLEVST